MDRPICARPNTLFVRWNGLLMPVPAEVSTEVLSMFARGYLECAIWADACNIDTGERDETASAMDYNDGGIVWPDDVIEHWSEVSAELSAFLLENRADIIAYVAAGRDLEHAGHDLWLTRNGHGAGFWDRGLGELGDRLTDAAHKMGGRPCFVGDGPTVILD